MIKRTGIPFGEIFLLRPEVYEFCKFKGKPEVTIIHKIRDSPEVIHCTETSGHYKKDIPRGHLRSQHQFSYDIVNL